MRSKGTGFRKGRRDDEPSDSVVLKSLLSSRSVDELDSVLKDPSNVTEIIDAVHRKVSERSAEAGQNQQALAQLASLYNSIYRNSFQEVSGQDLQSPQLCETLTALLSVYLSVRNGLQLTSPEDSESKKKTKLSLDTPCEALRNMGLLLLDSLSRVESDDALPGERPLQSQGRLLNVLEFLFESFPTHKAQFGTALLFCVLLRTSKRKETAADVSRLYKYREMLAFVDFEKESSQFFKTCLVNCFSSTAFLLSDTGRKLLVYALGSLDAGLSACILESIKRLVPRFKTGSQSLKKLGHVILSSWTNAQFPIKLLLDKFIQELVELAILCDCQVASKFRETLFPFYHKRTESASKLICRLFSPLLYRFLPVACWKVRFNATALFAVVFPSNDVNLPLSEYEVEIERQYQTLVKLTDDVHPEVRKVAVQGICRVLFSYWEMIPLENVMALLEALLEKSLKDKTSPQVRAAVLTGIGVVMENPMSRVALKKLLPTASASLHDTSALVRKSMSQLLESSKQFSGMEVEEIVSVESIIPRLVKDRLLSSVALCQCGKDARLSELSVNSDSYQCAKKLSEVMFSSVFGAPSFPHCIERVLLTAEKYPLALLAICEMTVKDRFSLPDRLKLSAALFHVAHRKHLELTRMQEKETLSEAESAKAQKRDALNRVLLQTAALLLKASTDAASSPVGGNPKRRKPRPTDQNRQLSSFLAENFKISFLESLLENQAATLHAVSDVLRIYCIVLPLMEAESLRRLKVRSLESLLRNCVESFAQSSTYLNACRTCTVMSLLGALDTTLKTQHLAQIGGRLFVGYLEEALERLESMQPHSVPHEKTAAGPRRKRTQDRDARRLQPAACSEDVFATKLRSASEVPPPNSSASCFLSFCSVLLSYPELCKSTVLNEEFVSVERLKKYCELIFEGLPLVLDKGLWPAEAKERRIALLQSGALAELMEVLLSLIVQKLIALQKDRETDDWLSTLFSKAQQLLELHHQIDDARVTCFLVHFMRKFISQLGVPLVFDVLQVSFVESSAFVGRVLKLFLHHSQPEESQTVSLSALLRFLLFLSDFGYLSSGELARMIQVVSEATPAEVRAAVFKTIVPMFGARFPKPGRETEEAKGPQKSRLATGVSAHPKMSCAVSGSCEH